MLILPIGDQPNDPKRVPWMNYALIAANALVFLFVAAPVLGNEAQAEIVMRRWGYLPSDPTLQTLFSSMFMHAGWMHLIGNMLFLWIFGDNIESRLGSLGYLFAYLGVGAAATLVFGAFNGDTLYPCVGASGAISGVQGLYFIACPKHKVRVFLWLYVFVRVTLVPARLIMGFWFVMNDIVPVVMKLPGQVAHMAHLGGFASGLVLMLILRPLVARIEEAAAREGKHAHRYQSQRSQRYRSRPHRLPRRPDV